MAWLAIDKIKRETISEDRPKFDGCEWLDEVVEITVTALGVKGIAPITKDATRKKRNMTK